MANIGFWSVVAAFVLTAGSAFFPLDAPELAQAERLAWFGANRGSFILGWAIQIADMTAWCAIMFVLAWEIYAARPIRAVVSGMLVLVSFVAFIIPKFMAVWTIPQLADAISSGAVGSDIAEVFFLLLNPSIPFTLFTSFDYLGFWMYAIFALLVAEPLYRRSPQSVALKIAAVALVAFGLSFHGMMIGLFTGLLASSAIEIVIGLNYLMIFIAFGAAAFDFKRGMKSES